MAADEREESLSGRVMRETCNRWNLNELNCGKGRRKCGALHITAATTTPTSNVSGASAPFVDMAELNLWKRMVVVAPLLLPRVGLRLGAREIGRLIAPVAASFSSGKSNGVVAANVMRHACSFDSITWRHLLIQS